MSEEEIEQTLLVVRECYVYKIPPRFTAAGHKAADWDLTAPLWTGRLVATGKGEKCVVKLEDPKTGDLFAICPVTESAIEPVTDSSRYFVMKIEDGSGRHAFIGMGFAERSEAFDFSSALQDHHKYVQQRKSEKDAVNRLESGPKLDFSLPEGAKIHVNIKVPKKPTTTTPTSTTTSGGGFGILPPPPGSSAVSTPKKSMPPTTSQFSAPSTSFFQNTPSQPTTTTTTTTSTSKDLFDFSDFTGGSNRQTQQQQPQPQPTQSSQQKPASFPDWVNF